MSTVRVLRFLRPINLLQIELILQFWTTKHIDSQCSNKQFEMTQGKKDLHLFTSSTTIV